MVNLGNSWDRLLAAEFESEYYLKLREFLKTEYKEHTVYPDMHDIFNALKVTAYEDVKVVILGQDPYHEPGQAHGMAFSVSPGIKQPPSLVNIFKELKDDLGIEPPPKDYGYLMSWAEQGVLLLNTCLTVRAHQAGSHRNKGWERLTDRIIELLAKRPEPLVFILWGVNARSKVPIIEAACTNAMQEGIPSQTGRGLSSAETMPKTGPGLSRHLILEGPHPSPLSAYSGFFGGHYFSKANEFLEAHGESPIDWRITH